SLAPSQPFDGIQQVEAKGGRAGESFRIASDLFQTNGEHAPRSFSEDLPSGSANKSRTSVAAGENSTCQDHFAARHCSSPASPASAPCRHPPLVSWRVAQNCTGPGGTTSRIPCSSTRENGRRPNSRSTNASKASPTRASAT